jgi:hypothetical protein
MGLGGEITLGSETTLKGLPVKRLFLVIAFQFYVKNF